MIVRPLMARPLYMKKTIQAKMAKTQPEAKNM